MAELPRFYDIDTDEFRPITQDDVNILLATSVAYGNLRMAMNTLHEQLAADVKAIRAARKQDMPPA